MTLALLSVSYGSPLLAVVGLKPITEDLGTQRQLVALVASLTWFGTGLGGIVMGQVAERIGIRATVMFGATMIALGLAVSATGNLWAILVGHAVLVGFLGNGALYPPLIVYVSRWFDRRRGIALALISSGQYIAGMIWPTLFAASAIGRLSAGARRCSASRSIVLDRGADRRAVSAAAAGAADLRPFAETDDRRPAHGARTAAEHWCWR